MTKAITFTIEEESIEYKIAFERGAFMDENDDTWRVYLSDVEGLSLNKFEDLIKEIKDKIYIV